MRQEARGTSPTQFMQLPSGGGGGSGGCAVHAGTHSRPAASAAPAVKRRLSSRLLGQQGTRKRDKAAPCLKITRGGCYAGNVFRTGDLVSAVAALLELLRCALAVPSRRAWQQGQERLKHTECGLDITLTSGAPALQGFLPLQ